jgi:nucleotide-binding universal stress UspA family protein
MIGSILIGLDEPGHAPVLEDLGIRWARRLGARLLGLAAIDEPGIRAIEPLGALGGRPGIDPVYHMGYEYWMTYYRRRSERLLEQFAARCAEAGVPHTELTTLGPPDEVIEREARACDLILLPRRSHFRFTADEDSGDEPLLKKILKHAPRPVVLVPEEPWPDGPAVVAYDGSTEADHALLTFLATGLAAGPVRVHVVGVGTRAAEASDLADRARRVLAEHHIEATTHAVESRPPHAMRLLEHIRRIGAGLVVMGARGQPRLKDLLLGHATSIGLPDCPSPLFLAH